MQMRGDAFASRVVVPFEISGRPVAEHGLHCPTSIRGIPRECVYKVSDASAFGGMDASMKVTCIDRFIEPTNSQCSCKLFLDFTEECSECMVLNSDDPADGLWEFSYDCSNVVSTTCAAKDVNGDCFRGEHGAPLAEPLQPIDKLVFSLAPVINAWFGFVVLGAFWLLDS